MISSAARRVLSLRPVEASSCPTELPLVVCAAVSRTSSKTACFPPENGISRPNRQVLFSQTGSLATTAPRTARCDGCPAISGPLHSVPAPVAKSHGLLRRRAAGLAYDVVRCADMGSAGKFEARKSGTQDSQLAARAVSIQFGDCFNNASNTRNVMAQRLAVECKDG